MITIEEFKSEIKKTVKITDKELNKWFNKPNSFFDKMSPKKAILYGHYDIAHEMLSDLKKGYPLY